jgi:hypothetical protein
MINSVEFSNIDTEVSDAINEIFDFMRDDCIDHNYILLLAHGDYYEYLAKTKLVPYVIDNRLDEYKDKSRQDFFIEFMRSFYGFPLDKLVVEDRETRITMELMIYTHVWESKPFLKLLYRVSEIVQDKLYPWKVVVPDMSKHDFIRNEIRQGFENAGMSLATVIRKAYHSTLRNAFAHSEYQFDSNLRQIKLDNYSGKDWDIDYISFDDWTKKFVYTALLSYHFFNALALRRKSLASDFNRSQFLIPQPMNSRITKIVSIVYESEWNRFTYSKNMP